VRHDEGLDVAALVEAVTAGGRVRDTPQPGVDQIENDELLTGPCDVLVPAALGQVIGGDNAAEVQASVVLEAANYPVTPDGDKVLGDRGITVVPDVLANAGGVTGSYFEWSQNIQQFRWKEERFNAELRDRMRLAYAATADTAAELGCTLRQAAFAIGIRRVAHASRLRGYV
jgi:glutamate dehydrogenase (NAD(P)+)